MPTQASAEATARHRRSQRLKGDGVTDVGDFDSPQTTEVLADDWWWYAIYLALAVGGMIAQFLDVDRRRDTLRSAWSTGIGSTTS